MIRNGDGRRHRLGFTRRYFSMRHSPTLFTAVLLLLFLGGVHVALGDDKPTSRDLGKIQPPGGVPLPIVRPGTTEIGVDELNKVRMRLEAVPRKDLEKWV